MTKDEALDLALEALESCGAGHITDGGNQWHDEKLVDKAITAIKQARSAPVQEPVACRTLCELCVKRGYNFCANAAKTTPIITTPPAAQRQWVGLNAEDCNHLYFRSSDVVDAISRTEAKLKEKNT
jgi:hypothetical protein